MTQPDPHPGEADKFADHLRAVPPAPLPAHWRAEILAAARAAVPPSSRRPRWRVAIDAFAAFLWPHPYAYAGLLAVWLLILSLRLSTPRSTSLPRPPAVAGTPVRLDYALAMERERLALDTLLFAPHRPFKEGQP